MHTLNDYVNIYEHTQNIEKTSYLGEHPQSHIKLNSDDSGGPVTAGGDDMWCDQAKWAPNLELYFGETPIKIGLLVREILPF